MYLWLHSNMQTYARTNIPLGASQQSGAVRLQYLSFLTFGCVIVPEKQQSLKTLIGI